MKFLRPLFLVFLLFASAYASATLTTAKIKYLTCHSKNNSSNCLVRLDVAPFKNGCSTADWQYALDGTTSEGKNMLAILLAAQMMDSKVTIGGNGVCTKTLSSEDIGWVHIEK